MGKKDDLDDEPLGLDKPGGEPDPQDEQEDADADLGAKGGTQDDGLEVVIADEDQAKDDVTADADHGEDAALAGAGDAAGDADELSEDDKGLSKNVQERIRREIRLRKRAVEAADGRAQAEATARQAAEHRMINLELATARMADKTLEVDIKDAKAELVKAQEEGETAKAVDAQQKLNELQIRRREIETLRVGLEEKVERAKTAPAPGARPMLRPVTTEWMGRNKWFGHEKFGVATAATKAIDTQMVKDGWDPGDPKYYVELDRRLNRELPGLRQRLRAETPRQENRPGPGTIVAPARQAPARGTSPNRVTLNRADLQNMRNFGMDPANKEHLKEYARSKQGVAANE